MTFKTYNRVLETSTTTGSGAYTLAGAVAGYVAFSAICADGDSVEYYAEDVDGNGVPTGGYEVGTAVWNTGGILTAQTVMQSSNSGAKVSWSAGTRRIGLTFTARSIVGLSIGNDLARAGKHYLW